MKGLVVSAAMMAWAVAADAADPKECTAIADDAVRLFCYDRALGRSAPPAPAPAPVPAPSPPAAAAPAPPAPVAIEPAPVVPPSPPPAAPAAPAAHGPETRIAGRFEGWSRGTRFKLDNGEVWEAVGETSYYGKAESPKVVITRDFFGQNELAVEGVRLKALVRRVNP